MGQDVLNIQYVRPGLLHTLLLSCLYIYSIISIKTADHLPDQDLDGRTDYVDYSTYVGPRQDYDKSDYNRHLDYGTVVGPADLRYRN